MLSKIIVSSYAVLLEISIWLILAGSFIGGWSMNGFWTGVVSLIIGFVICVALFGAFLILGDIRESVRAIEERQKASG